MNSLEIIMVINKMLDDTRYIRIKSNLSILDRIDKNSQ